RQIHGAGGAALDRRDERRISAGDPAGQVVVHRPGETGRSDEQRTRLECEAAPGLPREHDTAGGDESHAERNSPVDVLAEQPPREQRGQDAFQVQQQRGARRSFARQAEHEEHRPDATTGHDRAREPRKVFAAERCFSRRATCSAPGHANAAEAEAGSKIQEARQQPRVGDGEQGLGGRRTETEEERGAEREADRSSGSSHPPYFTNTHSGRSNGKATSPMIAVAATRTGLLTLKRNNTTRLPSAI